MARNPILIDLSEEGERDYNEEIRRIIDLTQDDDDDELPLPDKQQSRGHRRADMQRNTPLDSTHQSVPAYRINGVRVRVQDFVELAQPFGERQFEFVEVKQIWVNASGEVLLRGLPYARNTSLQRMDGCLERSVNEVCQILEIDVDDNRPDQQQAMIEVRPREVLTIRSFHKTNTDYHSARNCRFGNDPSWLRLGDSPAATQQRKELAPLTCRWKMRLEYRNYRFRRVAKAFGTTISHLAESEIDDPDYRVPDEERRREWLKDHPTAAGQALSPRKYLMCDAFCGSGGASSGARMGGLEPMIAIEMWETACESYRRNFPNAHLFWQSITDFVADTSLDGLPYCHVLHISPPCQYYSGAKVQVGKDDDANEVALFVCGDLIKKLRPRIVTMEQTFGLMACRFTYHFNKLIQDFTMHGYSVQWKERVEFVEYGLPQNRKRLIIIAAAPGEKLPPWPTPTHGNGRTPFVTEARAIGRLPRNVTLHDVGSARQVNEVARNPNTPLMRTITCGGPQGMMHYSGQRDYTLRETATLQSFPLTHEFAGPSRTVIKKQIGNAFPTCVAKVFFQGIREHLEREDRGRVSAPRPQAPPPASNRHFAFPGSSADDRRQLQPAGGVQQPRTQGPERQPGYSRLNGNLDEDEALQAAMRESRRERRTREVITIYDSDEDGLPDSMARLSVEPTQSSSSNVSSSSTGPPPSQRNACWPLVDLVSPTSPAIAVQPSPPTTGGSSSSQETSSSLSTFSAKWCSPDTPFGTHRRAHSSAASSVTLADSPPPSPSPSPCQQQSRKRKADDDETGAQAGVDEVGDAFIRMERFYAEKLVEREQARAAAREGLAGGDAGTESARKRARDTVDDAVMRMETFYEDKLAEREEARAAAREGMARSPGSVAERLAASGRPRPRQASAMSAGSSSREENGRPLTFGKWLGKLPVTRGSSQGWEF